MAELNSIRDTYDLVAKNYNLHFRDEHFKKPKDQEVLKKFTQKVKGKKTIWDLGCGCGHTTKYLFDLGLNISGLDLSSKMIEEAKSSYPNIEFQTGDILALEFENSSIDAVVSFYSIIHFSKEQVEKAFGEIYRVLKEKGVFLFSFHIGDKTLHLNEFLGENIDIDFMFFEVDFIVGLLQAIGFKKIEVIEREPYDEDIEYQSKRCYIFAIK